MTISEPAVILGAGTAVLVILFGVRLIMRAMGSAAAPPMGDEGSTTDGSGPPDVAGVIALPPLIFLAFLVEATVLEAVVPLPLLAGHALARYLAGADTVFMQEDSANLLMVAIDSQSVTARNST